MIGGDFGNVNEQHLLVIPAYAHSLAEHRHRPPRQPRLPERRRPWEEERGEEEWGLQWKIGQVRFFCVLPGSILCIGHARRPVRYMRRPLQGQAGRQQARNIRRFPSENSGFRPGKSRIRPGRQAPRGRFPLSKATQAAILAVHTVYCQASIKKTEGKLWRTDGFQLMVMMMSQNLNLALPHPPLPAQPSV